MTLSVGSEEGAIYYSLCWPLAFFSFALRQAGSITFCNR